MWSVDSQCNRLKVVKEQSYRFDLFDCYRKILTLHVHVFDCTAGFFDWSFIIEVSMFVFDPSIRKASYRVTPDLEVKRVTGLHPISNFRTVP